MEKDVLNKISAKFEVEGKIQKKQRIWIKVNKEDLIDLCRFVKEIGFEHLSAISVTDWLKDGEYEVTYHLWSYKDKILLTLKTRIDRDDQNINSVVPIWGENAQIHEREMHEMFGV
ncbi:MAG TPA: NADH-quinone oxidoreductase subunit C, partial [Euryarchaeota archaeon]|nr:NADH-quinone oxidoreductase subunit C [Euryarchaeota archaeon]